MTTRHVTPGQRGGVSDQSEHIKDANYLKVKLSVARLWFLGEDERQVKDGRRRRRQTDAGVC